MMMDEVDAEIRSLKFEIKDYRPRFTDAEMDAYYDSVQHGGMWMDFCRQIYIPGDTQGKMIDELMNLPNNPKYRWAFEQDNGHVTDYNQGFVLKEYKACLV
jgi:hypothetical protein